VSHTEHKSLNAVKARRFDAMSDVERAQFDEVYVAERKKIEAAERSAGD